MIKSSRTLPSVFIGFLGLAACATSAGPGESPGEPDGGGSSGGNETASSSGSPSGNGSGGGNASSSGGSSSGSGGTSSAAGTSSSSSGGSGAGGSSSGGTSSDDWLTTPTPANAMGAFPFPQDRKSNNCNYPTKISHAQIQNAYSQWLTTSGLVTSTGAPAGALRVQDPMTSNQTTSEGIAYGMLIAVYMSDKKTFDALWAYAQAHMANGLMSWQVTSGGQSTGGQVNSAGDSDQDMAWALVMADKQWTGGSYLSEAKSILTAIQANELTSGNNIKDGNYSSASSTHPDYAAPDYYKQFATVSGDTVWNAVYTAEYSQLTSAQNATTGLIPDAIGGSTFGYDACRAPWRVGLDYCWSGSSSAKSFLTPMVSFFVQTATVGGSVTLAGVKGIEIPLAISNGAQQTAYPSGAITGPAGVAAMMSASNQTFVDDTWTYLYQLVVTAASAGNLNYFSSTVGLISMLALSGNFIDYTNLPP